MSERNDKPSAGHNIFKSLEPSMSGKSKAPGLPPETPRSTRMDEALRLRQALHDSSSFINRKHLIGALKSPKTGDGAENRFDDTDDEYDEGFDVASFHGEARKAGENEASSLGTRAISSRAAILARLDLKTQLSPRADSAGAGGVSSQVFKDQLSARFKSRPQPARRMASTDSTDESRK